MNKSQVTPITWQSLIICITAISLAAAMRFWPLQALGAALVWVTFYPAVMAISIYGGFLVGLLGTFLACMVAIFYMPLCVPMLWK